MKLGRSWRRAVDYVELTLSPGLPPPALYHFPTQPTPNTSVNTQPPYRFLLLYDKWRINFIEAGLIWLLRGLLIM